MKVLKVYPNGEADLRDIDESEFFYEIEGEPIDNRIFVDKTLVMISSDDAGLREGRNIALPSVKVYGTVLFLRAKSKGKNYIGIDEETVRRLLDRFPKINFKEEICKTSSSLRARFKAWLTRILTASRRRFLF